MPGLSVRPVEELVAVADARWSRRDITAFTQRWDPSRAAQAHDALFSGGSLVAASFGDADGRLDFRGLPGPSPALLGTVLDLPVVDWQHIDLSGARFESLRLTRSRIVDCRFEQAVLPDLRVWGSTVTDSSFASASLPDFMAGPPAPEVNVFVGCSFDRARLAGFMSSAGRFESCAFTNVKLRATRFMSTVFTDCDFRGAQLREVMFDGRDLSSSTGVFDPANMRGCDFSDAVLDDVSFAAVDVATMALPSGRDYLVVPDFAARYAVAREWVRTSPEAAACGQARDVLLEVWPDPAGDSLPPAGGAGLVNFTGVRLPGVPELEELARAAWDVALAG